MYVDVFRASYKSSQTLLNIGQPLHNVPINVKPHYHICMGRGRSKVGESTANLPPGSGIVNVCKLTKLKFLLSFSKQFAGASSTLGHTGDYTSIVAPVVQSPLCNS